MTDKERKSKNKYFCKMNHKKFEIGDVGCRLKKLALKNPRIQSGPIHFRILFINFDNVYDGMFDVT